MWFYWEIAIGCLNPIFRRAFLDNGSQLFAPRKATNMFNERVREYQVEIGAPDFWRWIASITRRQTEPVGELFILVPNVEFAFEQVK